MINVLTDYDFVIVYFVFFVLALHCVIVPVFVLVPRLVLLLLFFVHLTVLHLDLVLFLRFLIIVFILFLIVLLLLLLFFIFFFFLFLELPPLRCVLGLDPLLTAHPPCLRWRRRLPWS